MMGVSLVLPNRPATRSILTDEPPLPTSTEVLIELARHHLTPEVLYVARFIPTEIGGFLGHATDTLTIH